MMRGMSLLALFASLALSSSPSSLVITFGSICCGTDHQAGQRLQAVLAGTKAKVSGESWGKEGEYDVCLDLSPLSEAERSELVAKVNAALATAKHVSFKTDARCPKR